MSNGDSQISRMLEATYGGETSKPVARTILERVILRTPEVPKNHEPKSDKVKAFTKELNRRYK